MVGNLLKNQKGVRINLEFVQKMFSFSIHFSIHFLRNPQKQWVLDQIPGQRSLIGKGGQLFAIVFFRQIHKGFQRIHSTKNKKKMKELSIDNFIAQYLLYMQLRKTQIH